MRIIGYKYWGAYSGVPLEIVFEDNEKEKLNNRGVVDIECDFISYDSSNMPYHKKVSINKKYLNEIVIYVDLSAIFKSCIERDLNVISGIVGEKISATLKVSVSAMYYNNDDIEWLRDDSGVKLEVKDEFEIFAGNFVFDSASVNDNEKELKGMRVCNLFHHLFKKTNKPYTTYFKGYKQNDWIISTIKPFNLERSERDTTKGIKPYVDRVIDECGIFLAWLNDAGTWSYWLFSNEYVEEIKTKSLGSMLRVNRTFADYSILRNFGYTAYKTWTLKSAVPVMEGELDELKSLLTSSMVFLRLLDKDNRNFDVAVSVVNGSYKFDINKQDVYPFSVTIEFEALKTMTML